MEKIERKVYLPAYVVNIKLYCLMFFILTQGVVHAQTLTISASPWNVNFMQIVEAGEDYVCTYESAASQILLNARVPLLLSSGKVSVHYEANPTWNDALKLSVRRTGNGTTLCVLCSISGGTNYQNITTVGTELFNIKAVLALAAYNDVPIQLRLSGVSVKVPAANYQSRVVFTIGPL